jgi:branched-chain amino acid transport system ATP-binding protein
MTALIQASRLRAGYGEATTLWDVDIEVHPGEVVALLGPNGAGKTTTLLTLAGELKPTAGEVLWNGAVSRSPLERLARDGLAYVSEERSVFSRLTVTQNLKLGRDCDVDKALTLFPPLAEITQRRGGLLSGGEQQMLTLARALSRPTRLLMADEMSLGLAPKTVGILLNAVRRAADGGMGALVVEQHVHRVLKIADRVYVLRQGRVQFAGTADDARAHIDEIQQHYLGATRSPIEATNSALGGQHHD